MKDPLEELLDTLPEIEDLQVRSKFIIIAARLNRQVGTRRKALNSVSDVLQDIRLNMMALQHDLESTRRERDALKS